MSKREVTEFDLRRPEFQDHRLTPDMFEFDATGDVVRKDRFERGIRKIHGMLCSDGVLSSRDQWVTEDVVAAVKSKIDGFNRLKNLILISGNIPESAEYFHFDNRCFVRNIDQEQLDAAKNDGEGLINFESSPIDGEWEEDSGWLPLIEVLVSIEEIKKEFKQLSGFEEPCQ
ncbi:hypothetical protein QDR31_01000 [Acinetobacter baumannii]|uniref:hypothetical protein n=1 Tax=Acinetobacter baumannii TaxID=470 RepID=UPI0024493859|nr:hypothetical protein [Acinetobacter baumannii]MDH2493670.1 hypothetical protein [Acinetobacter baumannii]